MNTSIETISSVFIGAVALAVALGCDKDDRARTGGGATPSATPASSPELTVSAAEIIGAYKGNEVAADAKYKGKVVEITGIVGDIKKDILDDIYITVGTGKRLEIPEVQCFIADGMADRAGSLSKGTKITVKGVVDGLMMNVLVKDCRF